MRYSSEFLREKLWGKIRNPVWLVGGELNLPEKDFENAFVRMAFVFPDLYEVGMSNLGWQILYHIVNNHPRYAAERAFAVTPEVETIMKRERIYLYSLETYTSLDKFDIIGISLSHELLFSTMLQVIDLAGLPFRSEERDKLPIIIAGGPGVANPEPIAPFVDATFHGDGEEAIIEIMEVVEKWKKIGGAKKELLGELAKIEGVYVPAFYKPVFKSNRVVEYNVDVNIKKKVRSRLLKNFEGIDYPVKQITPLTQVIHDRFTVEVARGCVRSCRFCQAGMIYRPVKEKNIDDVLGDVLKGIMETGMSDVSFLSLSIGDYSRINELVGEVMRWGEREKVALSFPSVRIDTLSKEVLEQIKKVRKTGFTIAPETGSDRLRRVINKYWTNREVVETARVVGEAGWRLIKLYFMVGLPLEMEEDRDAIVELVAEVKKVIKNVNASVALFVPKPHTPFQWEKFVGVEEGWNFLRGLGKKIRKVGAGFKWHSPEMSYVEVILGRGDRRLADVIQFVYENGGRFDSWNEHFRFDLWLDGFRKYGIDPEIFAGELPENIFLPWSHIDYRIQKKFLLRERKKAREGKETPFCLADKCSACGVCDFKEIDNVISRSKSITLPLRESPTGYKKWLIKYRRKGIYSYIPSRDLTRNWGIFFRKANIDVMYSEGHHPLPKLSFIFPAPVGVESEEEYVEARIDGNLREDDIIRKLEKVLPEEFLPIEVKKKSISESNICGFRYVAEGRIDENRVKNFLQQEEIPWIRIKKGRKKEKNLKKYVEIIEFSPNRLIFDIIVRDDGMIPVVAFFEKGLEMDNPFSKLKIKRSKILFKGEKC